MSTKDQDCPRKTVELNPMQNKVLIVSFISEMLYWMAAVAYFVVGAIYGGFPPAASIAVTIIVFCLNCLVPLCGLVGSAKKNRMLIFLYRGFSILQAALWFANIVFYTAIVIVGIILAFAQFILSILGVAWGNQLYNSKETWPEVFALSMAVVTTQQPHVQPTGVVVGQPAVAVEAVSVQDMQAKV
eukprot:g943.t1